MARSALGGENAEPVGFAEIDLAPGEHRHLTLALRGLSVTGSLTHRGQRIAGAQLRFLPVSRPMGTPRPVVYVPQLAPGSWQVRFPADVDRTVLDAPLEAGVTLELVSPLP